MSLERPSLTENIIFDPRESTGLRMPCAFFGSSRRLLIVGGYWEGKLALFSAESLNLVKVFQQHMDTVTCLAVDPINEDILITGGRNGELIRWVLDERDPFLLVKEAVWDHTDIVTEIAISHELRVFASSSMDGTALVYNLYTGQLMRQFNHPDFHGFSHVSLSVSPLPLILLFSKKTKEFLAFSINGQFLSKKRVEFEQVLSRSIQKDQSFDDILVFYLS